MENFTYPINLFSPKLTSEVSDDAPEGSYIYQIVPSGPSLSDEECAKALMLSKQKSIKPKGIFYHCLSAILHGSVLFGAMILMPPLHDSYEDDLSQDQIYMLSQELSKVEAEKEEDIKLSDKNEQNILDNHDSKEISYKSIGNSNQTSSQKGSDNAKSLSRSEALQDAATFGMIGLVNNLSSDSFRSDWGNIDTNSNEKSNLWSSSLDDSTGSGSLNLSGIGEGSQNVGNFIGIGRVGTVGNDLDGKFDRRFKQKGHNSQGPIVRMGQTTVSSSTLAPELIQRVVRQNFGRFRGCYENGLRSNPSLSGRVSVRFIIGRDGSVSSAQNGGSDLPSNDVVNCVTRAFYGLSFPAPKDGIVTVTYPILFSYNQ